MLNRVNISKLIGITFVITIILTIFLISYLIIKQTQNKIEYVKYEKPAIDIKLKGNYIEYINIGEKYKEKGATTTSDGQIVTSYYKKGKRTNEIDTTELTTYTVNYTITKQNISRTIKRIVIVTDNKKPTIIVPNTETITSIEAITYDLKEGIITNDNSGQVKLSIEGNITPIEGDHIITYIAIDSSGNKTTKKRLIKVTSGITFTYEQNKLTISYPEGNNYIYKYSLDKGTTFIETQNNHTIDIKEGTVIASVYNNSEYIMSNTYTIKS